jgi:hypothetical protein
MLGLVRGHPWPRQALAGGYCQQRPAAPSAETSGSSAEPVHRWQGEQRRVRNGGSRAQQRYWRLLGEASTSGGSSVNALKTVTETCFQRSNLVKLNPTFCMLFCIKLTPTFIFGSTQVA